MLASGEWHDASIAFRSLLGPPGTAAYERSCRPVSRRRCAGSNRATRPRLRGRGGRPVPALGRHEDALTASYWLAYARFQCADVLGAHALLRPILDDPALHASGDLRIRILMALGSIATDQGDHAAAADWLDRARVLSDDLDDRRRASLLSMVATSRAASGDVEGAVRAGAESLALYRSAEARHEAAVIENDLAMACSSRRPGAGQGVCRGRAPPVRDRGRPLLVAHVADTEARIALAADAPQDALPPGGGGGGPCHRVGQRGALSNALVTSARSLGALGRSDEAFDRLRTGGRPAAGRGRTARPAGSPHGPRRPARWPGAAPRGLRPDPRGARDPWPDGRATHGGRCRRRPSACVTSPASVKQWCIVPCDRRPPGGPVPDTGSCRGGRRRATGSAASAALPARATSRVPSPRRLRCVDG